MRFGTYRMASGILAAALITAAAAAQSSGGQSGAQSAGAQPASGPRLEIPQDVNFVPTRTGPIVARATAVVNDEIITQSDVNQRTALRLAVAGAEVPREQMEQLRAQMLRDLIDETLQVQAAKTADIKIEQKAIDQEYARIAQRLGQTATSFGQFLTSIGSSERSLKRQVMGQLAWQQLLRRLVRVSVTDEEIKDYLERLDSSRGMPEYHVAEIYLKATPENASQVRAQLAQLVEQLKRPGSSFAAVARQYSDATTAARGGDLGWVRPEQLPAELATVVQQLPVGALSDPIQLASGFSVVALVDSRQVLVADPRDAQLSLMQMAIELPAGTTEAVARQRAEQLGRATQAMGGCGRAEATARDLKAELVATDQMRVRDLPPPLQPIMLQMNVGQATAPFGSIERISVLVLCGRDDAPPVETPTRESVADALEEQRMQRQANRYLRDLRRDAIIEYR
ncbi:MAG TPA: peptidylprolyl isomerase [Allosphingosinicella sp.]|nr:peptidylprolyl isomerase [Allosphingosinicella sp.]